MDVASGAMWESYSLGCPALQECRAGILNKSSQQLKGAAKI